MSTLQRLPGCGSLPVQAATAVHPSAQAVPPLGRRGSAGPGANPVVLGHKDFTGKKMVILWDFHQVHQKIGISWGKNNEIGIEATTLARGSPKQGLNHQQWWGYTAFDKSVGRFHNIGYTIPEQSIGNINNGRLICIIILTVHIESCVYTYIYMCVYWRVYHSIS